MKRKQSGATRRLLWRSLLVVMSGGVLVGLFAGYKLLASAPDVSQLRWETSTVIYDRNGGEMYRLHGGQNRTPIKLSEVPQYVRDAFQDIEDPDFQRHHGVNVRGIVRAVFRSILYLAGLPGGRLEGGSTITQQLVRDAWLSHEVTLKRKLQEMWVALQVERRYTKDEILEMYLNQIYFGKGAYGIEAAAKTFFAKSVGELTLAEAAQLAGMINGPSYFDPFEHVEASIERRNLVLGAMLREGHIDSTEYEEALAQRPVLSTKNPASEIKAGYFIDYVIRILQESRSAEQYGVSLGEIGSVARAGLRVYTTMDPYLQRLAEQTVTTEMVRADREYGLEGVSPRPEAAMVVMRPATGEVLALVGGREHRAMLEFNRATDALRQPGSVIKPIVAYLPALESGLTPATILDDSPVMLTTDRSTVWPQNYDFKYQGLKPMRFGVEQSINPMAVRALQAAGGAAKGAEYGRRFGLATIGKEDEHLALALGGLSKGTTVLDVTGAYAALANMGTRSAPVLIRQIVDRNGNVLFEAQPKKSSVVRPATAYLMIDMMKGVIRRGTAYGFTGGFKGWPVAGKTGTTEFNRDSWFVGFTSELVATVWNGYDDPKHHLPWTGAFVPVKIWNRFMEQALSKRPDDWRRPSDVITAPVCFRTGMLPDERCPKDQVGDELFINGSQPQTPGEMLVKTKAVQVPVKSPDKKSTYLQWQLWQSGCAGTPVERIFIRRPQPRVLHPTMPFHPSYVPADAGDELPVVTCELVPIWRRLLPKLLLPDQPPRSDKENESLREGT